MYRKTDRYRKMRAARERKRLESPSPEYPAELPLLRRKLIIIDYDFEETSHVFELQRSNRIDCYRVFVDGRLWRDRIGWSHILQALRKSMPRVRAL